MSLYICKWPNGDFSAVNAKNREEAAERLDDEVGYVEAEKLLVCNDFMVNFKLPEKVTDDNAADMLPPISLETFGEDMTVFLCDNVYAEYGREAGNIFDERAKGTVISTEEELERLNGALAAEKDDV